jgi:zinc protease
MRRFMLAAACLALGLAALTGCVTTRSPRPGRPDPRPSGEAADTPAGGAEAFEGPREVDVVETVTDLQAQDPLLHVRVVMRAGSADDPAGKEGLAALTARLMREATEKLGTAALAETLFPWAAQLDVQIDKDTIVFLGRVHRDHAEAFADLLLDVIVRPRLDPGDFARVRDEQRSFLQTTLRAGDDEALQRETLEALLYDGARLVPAALPRAGRHPYAHTPSGTVQGLTAITLDDVVAFRRSHVTRDRLLLGVAGGASDALVKKLQDGLSGLPARGAPRLIPKAPAQPTGNVVVLVDKEAAGSAISVGFTPDPLAPDVLDRRHPDYPALKLAETWFGEHRNLVGHLFNAMRERRGLNYGDYAYVEHFVQEGGSTYEALNIPRRTPYFSMWIRPVEHKNRLFALRQSVWELQRFVEHGIPDEASFARVRAFVQGYWRQKEQDPLRALGYRMDAVLTGMPFDRAGLRARVARLSRADVNAAIRRHLRADRLSIVVVTRDAATLRKELLAGAPSKMSYASPPDAALQREDALIDALDLRVAADHVVVVEPGALFER